jgi:hypothetical protein
MYIGFLNPYERLDQLRDLSFQSLKSCHIHEATLRMIADGYLKSEDATNDLLRYTETKKHQNNIEVMRAAEEHPNVQLYKVYPRPIVRRGNLHGFPSLV